MSTAGWRSWWCWSAILLEPDTGPTTGAAGPATEDTVLVFMHPIGGGAYLPMVNALARAGHHVIYAGSRFRGTDSDC